MSDKENSSFEKYGVVVDNDEACKTAAEEKLCPQCGTPLLPVDEQNVPKCVNCGTAPFEDKHGRKI